MRILFIILILQFNLDLGITKENHSNSTNNNNFYWVQAPPDSIPKIFAKGIISTDEYEFGGTFSIDGKEYYFTRRPTYEGYDNRIYVSKFINNQWTKPILASFAKDVFEFEPMITPDGSRLFFYSERKKPVSAKNNGNLWYTKRIGNKWNEPEYFSNPINKEYVMMVSSTINGNLYFAGVINKKRGIFRLRNSSKNDEDIEYLPEEINSIHAAHPFISPDEKYIIFDSQVTGRGKPELYIAFRKDDGSWTKAINMGPMINATKTEFGASVSPDGKYLFFNRVVNGNGDIYWVDAIIIKKLKHKALNN